MPYITRDDGERFVIPSYRDVLSATRKNLLKKEIIILSQSYGEYITLQRKGANQYEVAFSPDSGYLLGESVWQYFKRPLDMVYCEAIPNTTEALLVIVKSGSVYLDGQFPIESIPEELIVFKTQKNNFDIYVYGETPLAESAEVGKFNFDEASVKSFTILDKPIFATLPLYKAFQLQLVEPVLKAHNIGVYPVKQVLAAFVFLGLGWMLWSMFTEEKPEEQQPIVAAEHPNPYQPYYDKLMSPAPTIVINGVLDAIENLYAIPGWTVRAVNYQAGTLIAQLQSNGYKIQSLIAWFQADHTIKIEVKPNGIFLYKTLTFNNRPIPSAIYPLQQIVANLLDNLANVYPGNIMQIGDYTNVSSFLTSTLTIDITDSSPITLRLVAAQFDNLPLVLQGINFTVTNGSLSGSIKLLALGNQS
jgi:hypothetical protein